LFGQLRGRATLGSRSIDTYCTFTYPRFSGSIVCEGRIHPCRLPALLGLALEPIAGCAWFLGLGFCGSGCWRGEAEWVPLPLRAVPSIVSGLEGPRLFDVVQSVCFSTPWVYCSLYTGMARGKGLLEPEQVRRGACETNGVKGCRACSGTLHKRDCPVHIVPFLWCFGSRAPIHPMCPLRQRHKTRGRVPSGAYGVSL
jgi:hypothetical protein